MTDKSKSAKKGWHTRRVNSRYKEIRDLIDLDSGVKETLDNNKDLINSIQDSTNEMIKMRFEYDSIMDKLENSPNLIETLPIDSMKDLCEFDKYGKISKGTFNDVIKAGEIRRKGLSLSESKIKLSHEAQIAQIDLLKAQCDALLKLIDKN